MNSLDVGTHNNNAMLLNFRLLRCGANIGIRNKDGRTPIDNIDPAIMEEFLDECLTARGAPVDADFKLMFKYSFLAPQLKERFQRGQDVDEEGGVKGSEPETTSLMPEAEPLFYLSQSPRHRHLLTHPIVSSFLCLKWRRIRPYYYVNLTFYLTFVASLTAYLLLGATTTTSNEEGSDAVTFFKWITLALLVVLTARELLQAMVSCWRYWSSLENLMEVCMLACTYVVLLCGDDCDPKLSTCLSGAALILSWAEMVLMFGRHPKLSTFITMFSTVSLNFFYFLTWYLSIILAFGLTFFILLHRDGKTDEDGEELNAYFSSPSRSLFKTVVMSLTGEIEFEGIDFGGLFAIAVFLAYVFFVMLVLVNLLNGLAVSDIAEIQKHAEVVSHVSRVELISYMESMLLGDPFSFLSNSSSSGRRRRLPDGSCVGRGLYALSPVRRLLGAVIGNTLLFQRRYTIHFNNISNLLLLLLLLLNKSNS